MQDLRLLVISAINENMGSSENPEGYDVAALQGRIRATTTRLNTPPQLNRDFLNLLESGTVGGKFMKKCIESGMQGSLACIVLMFINGSDDTPITSDLIMSSGFRDQFAQITAGMIRWFTMTLWDFREIHKIATTWHHKKLAIYVAEFWNTIKRDYGPISSLIAQEMTHHRYFVPPWTTAQQEVSCLGVIAQMAIIEYTKTMTEKMRGDPEFTLWITMDTMLSPSRTQTEGTGESDERLMQVITLWLTAGLDAASGYLQVALDKCNSDRKQALALYRKSFWDLFWTIGMMNHDFIALFPRLVRNPEWVREIANSIKEGDIGYIDTVLEQLSLFADPQEPGFGVPEGCPWKYDQIVRLLVQRDRSIPYDADFFEVTQDNTLRIKQWLIDFIRLIHANRMETLGENAKTLGCPMMHSRLPTETWSMVYMQDFSETFANIVEEFWKRNSTL